MLNVLQYLGVGAGAAAVMGLVVLFFLRGVWSKFGTAMMRAEIALWWNHKEQRDAMRADVKEIIDNEVQRADGLIRKAVSAEVNGINAHVDQRIQAVLDKMERMSDVLGDVVERLSRLEGTTDLLAKRSGMSGSMPQLPPTPPADATGRQRPMPR